MSWRVAGIGAGEMVNELGIGESAGQLYFNKTTSRDSHDDAAAIGATRVVGKHGLGYAYAKRAKRAARARSISSWEARGAGSEKYSAVGGRIST